MNIISQNPHFVKWSDKKKKNLIIARKMIDAGFKERGVRMQFCSQFLNMKTCPDCGKSVVSSANLCRDRLCPTCSWRLSLKRYAEMCATFAFINESECFDAGFLTLTVKNCKPSDLRYTILKMSEAWNRMRNDRWMKDKIIGSAKSLEITYNEKSKTFHPHFHIIMLYKPTSEKTMRQRTHELWDNACRLEYVPITDFRVIKSEDNTNIDNDDISGAILETFKYSVKSDELAPMPLDIFRSLIVGIGGIRTVSYTGIIKQARQKLGYKKDELEENEEIEIKKCPCGSQMQEAILYWSFSEKQYKILRKNFEENQKN